MVNLKPKKYPEKTCVNLVIREHTPRQISRAAGLALVLAVAVGLFCKFAVIDRLAAANRAEAAAQAAVRQLETLQAANADYNEVLEEYARAFSLDPTADGTVQAADCLEVLALVEGQLMPGAGVAAFSYTANVLSVQLTGITLNGASALLAGLYQNPMVANVELSTADAEVAGVADENATLTMTVLLNVEGGEGA